MCMWLYFPPLRLRREFAYVFINLHIPDTYLHLGSQASTSEGGCVSSLMSTVIHIVSLGLMSLASVTDALFHKLVFHFSMLAKSHHGCETQA